jgi:hypothetical protein
MHERRIAMADFDQRLQTHRLWGHCQLRRVGNGPGEFIGYRFDRDQH